MKQRIGLLCWLISVIAFILAAAAPENHVYARLFGFVFIVQLPVQLFNWQFSRYKGDPAIFATIVANIPFALGVYFSANLPEIVFTCLVAAYILTLCLSFANFMARHPEHFRKKNK